MGGVDKALLASPRGGTLLERNLELFEDVMLPCVIVGSPRRIEPYAKLKIVRDAASGIGPLGGLVALLERARGGFAIAIACDMPYLSSSLLERLRDAPWAPIVAPKRSDRWEPLFARYDADLVLPLARDHVARKIHSLQRLLEKARATELVLTEKERSRLTDWDEPGDLNSGSRGSSD
jgi:molybdopterin-guanine dinucleotide biosynthesis protein A